MALKINPTPNFTTIITGHGNINTYLHKFRIIGNPACPCNKGDQMVDHIIYNCLLHEQEREKLKAAIQSLDKWPVRKSTLATKYYKRFKLFTDNIVINIEQGHM